MPSHRQAPVKDLNARVRRSHRVVRPARRLRSFSVMAVDGAWDALVFGVIRDRVQHVVCANFPRSSPSPPAPRSCRPRLVTADPGSGAVPESNDIDAYAWPQNETPPCCSPAAESAVRCPMPVTPPAAGGMQVDVKTDGCHFARRVSPDGGLWFAVCFPRRHGSTSHTSDRWVPPSLDLHIAVENSRKEQTYNTPALATLLLLEQQLNWMRDLGGLSATAARSADSSSRVYEWAEKSSYAEPFVKDPQWRSPVVTTVDLDGVDGTRIIKVLRENGIVDIDPYRALGRNQLRIGVYPAVDPDDVSALLSCIDWVTERL